MGNLGITIKDIWYKQTYRKHAPLRNAVSGKNSASRILKLFTKFMSIFNIEFLKKSTHANIWLLTRSGFITRTKNYLARRSWQKIHWYFQYSQAFCHFLTANSPEDTSWFDDNKKAALRVFLLALLSTLQQENLTKMKDQRNTLPTFFPG